MGRCKCVLSCSSVFTMVQLLLLPYCCHSVVEAQFCCFPSARFRRSPYGDTFTAGCLYSPRCQVGEGAGSRASLE
jgi:hypothetical protein